MSILQAVVWLWPYIQAFAISARVYAIDERVPTRQLKRISLVSKAITLAFLSYTFSSSSHWLLIKFSISWSDTSLIWIVSLPSLLRHDAFEHHRTFQDERDDGAEEGVGGNVALFSLHHRPYDSG